MECGFAKRLLPVLHLAAVATFALFVHRGAANLRPCPRPDVDCVYQAFAASLSVKAQATTKGSNEELPPVSLKVAFDAASDTSSVNSGSTKMPDWSWSYRTHNTTLDFLQQIVRASGGLCRLDWLSPLSVEGRQIVAVVVGASNRTTNSSSGLPKPSFTWIGNMHGDETANRELLLRLVWGLCSGELANSDSRWRDLQASTVVRIVPSMNPDGYTRRQRNNRARVDLNRNFLTPAFPYGPPPPGLALARNTRGSYKYQAAAQWWLYGGNMTMQPESQAIASYLISTLPDLSANLHGGEVVANYPLDACDRLGAETWCPSAEEPVPGVLATTYASANPLMVRNRAPSFVNGTVQGAAWYPVLGSLQDWMYHTLKLMHLTLELHAVKDPDVSSLPALWTQNVRSMLRFMEVARMGLRGCVLDATTRAPLAANVSVLRPAGVRGTVADAAREGYFFKFMAPELEYEFNVQPFNPTNRSELYQVINFRATLPVRRANLVAGNFLAIDLTVEKVLMAYRRTGPASTRK